MAGAHDSIDWITAGTTFDEADIVHYQGRDDASFADVAGRFDLILTGPHATAALPAELAPWLDPAVDQRLQYDFSDVTTSALCRAWAMADERVLYVENPHPRVLFDPNRPHPDDPEGDLHEFFRRARENAAGGDLSYGGVDGLRPITFSGRPFLREPASEDEWRELIGLLESLAERGSKVYRHVRDDVIDRVYRAKAARLSTLDLASVSRVDLASARTLIVNNVHDTMNGTIRPDGSVDVPRPETDRLPSLVSLGNRGDRHGEARSPDDGALLSDADVPTMTGDLLRSVRRAIQLSFDIDDDDVAAELELNKPYLGAYEVQRIGRQLRRLDERGPVRHVSGEGMISMRSGAVQSEFLRERLLGPANTALVRSPGTTWPQPDEVYLAGLADRLATAFDLLRRWDFDLPPITPHRDPRYR